MGDDPWRHLATDARTAAAGKNSGSSRPKGMWSVDLLFGPRFYSWGFCSMNESKSKKNAPVHDGFEWAGAVARVRRGVRSNRAGRRAALLGMLTAAYANSSRGGRIGDRSAGER
jgi:hypothetical protein